MNKKLEAFRERFCFTKEEVQRNFESFIEHHRTPNNEEGYSEQYRKCFLELCDRFKETLDRCNLPALTEDWWFYDYEVTNDGIVLKLLFCEELNLDQSGDIGEMTFSENFTLLDAKCDYVTVEQFTALHNVTATTVRQWIRRGKLRTAKKTGRDWLIPVIAGKPGRGFEMVTYIWDALPKKIEEDYPFLKDSRTIFIHQDEKQKTHFNYITGFPGDDNRISGSLSLKEREKLELDLISCPLVEVEPSFIMFKPYKNETV